ncbi:MAG: hypothetical protein Q7U47_04390 [Paludibacter sp.]|nr:hypothetical protein [Paludibacter sp.]
MENTTIKNHAELLQRIEVLKTDRNYRKEELRFTFNKLVSLLDLISIFKKTPEKEQPIDIVKTGVNMAINLIVDLIFGKHRSIKGYLSSVLVEKFTTILIDNNLINIISGINSFFHRNKKQ